MKLSNALYFRSGEWEELLSTAGSISNKKKLACRHALGGIVIGEKWNSPAILFVGKIWYASRHFVVELTVKLSKQRLCLIG